MKMKETAPKIGRPRSFDREAALEAAMIAFWHSGYETTSITDLTGVMGISAPSLYAAFVDKEQLFLEAMRRYCGDSAAFGAAIDAAPSARDAARSYLTTAAASFSRKAMPKGCLIASATATGSAASSGIRTAAADFRRGIRRRLQHRIQRDIDCGILPRSTDAHILAGYLLGVVQGMSMLARDGASRRELLAIVETSLGALPRPIGSDE